jgi:hypothetical protein
VGDGIISQTSIESSNSFISHSPFYGKHDLVLENISCSLKEKMMGVDHFIQGERKNHNSKHIFQSFQGTHFFFSILLHIIPCTLIFLILMLCSCVFQITLERIRHYIIRYKLIEITK